MLYHFSQGAEGDWSGTTFNLTLTQLERLQRMRMGQPVLPPIKVEISP